MLKVETKTNHFALKTKLYVNALQSAFSTSRELNPVHLSAEGELYKIKRFDKSPRWSAFHNSELYKPERGRRQCARRYILG